MNINKNMLVVILCLLFKQVIYAGAVADNPQNDSLRRFEFDYRMQMAFNRLTSLKMIPAYTEEFILADVNIDSSNPRRFYNFSGDLSGRYIEVLSMADKKSLPLALPRLVRKLITFQKTDGRFGSDKLEFTEDKVSGEHMALLWGNGRLLVGLMQYYKEYKDEQALEAARRLGDFFISSYKVCTTPAVSKRLEGMMAMGIICFTQYIEGLVLLSEYSKDPKYAQIAAETYKVLPPRGKQHTHGYLSTLRGVLMLFNYDHNKEHLDFVRSQYEDLIHSHDYTPFGSVREYFGHMDVDRDEGCSTADFVRLSFDLYNSTKDKTYIERGEYALLNALYFNQYYTGDFGHHILTAEGSSPDFLHTSWWCCTMHGLRAMYEVRKSYMVEEDVNVVKINLYLETAYAGKMMSLSIQNDGAVNDTHFYDIRLNSFKSSIATVALRVPEWSATAAVWLNGTKVVVQEKDGYLMIDKVKTGDVIRIGFKYKVNIHTDDGKTVELSQLTNEPVSGYLHYGPYLLGADDKSDAVFTAEPNENIVFLKTKQASPDGTTKLPATYYPIRYEHGGFPSDLGGMLRPVSALTFDKHGYLMARLVFAKDGGSRTGARSSSMLAPFNPNSSATEPKKNKKTY